jgi:hypothetical protein
MTCLRVFTLALLLALVSAGSAGAGVRVAARDEPVAAVASPRAPAVVARVLPARTAPFRFNLVGLHWRGPGGVAFRTAPARGAWGAWRPARPEAEDAPDPRTREGRARAGWKLGNPHWTGAARRIQYRIRGRVTALRAHFLWSPLRAQPPVRTAAAIPGQPPVVTRAAWGADESIVRGAPSYASRLAFSVVHHTAGTRPTSPSQSAAVVRGILTYHVRSNGWNDVGYNFLVDPFGQIFEGRAGGIARNVVGAHAAGFNTGSVGVAVLGTYDASKISADAREALTNLLAWRLDLAHVDPTSRLAWTSAGSNKYPAGTVVSLAAVSGHRDVGSTACPGSALYATLGSLAGETLARGGPKLVDPRVKGSVGGPVRFTARLTAPLPWTVSVLNGAGAVVATGAGSGTTVDWVWDAAGAPADRYTYSIAAGPDVRPARGPVDGTVPLELTALSVSPPVLTPNGDGLGEKANVLVTATKEAVLALRLEPSSGGTPIPLVTSRAVAAGRTAVTWGGRNAAGRAVPDGRYRLVAELSSGSERSSQTAAVVVDRTLGRLAAAPSPFSPNGDAPRDTAAVSFELAREAAVSVRVLSGSRVVATLAAGRRGPGRQALGWDGRSGGALVADGRLRVVVDASTSLGLRRLERPLVLDTRAPRLSGLSARRSRGGTLVSVRVSEPALVTVRFGRATVRVWRGPGPVRLWRRGRVSRVSVSALDPAGNVGRSVSAPVRR